MPNGQDAVVFASFPLVSTFIHLDAGRLKKRPKPKESG